MSMTAPDPGTSLLSLLTDAAHDPFAPLRQALLGFDRKLLPDLLPGERETLGGHIIPQGPALVLGLVTALRDKRRLFPRHARLAEELIERQRKAISLGKTEAILVRLLDLVRQNRVREQSLAIQRAKQIIADIDDDDRRWEAGLTGEELASLEFFRAQVAPRFLRKNLLWPVRLVLSQMALCRNRSRKPAAKPKASPYLRAVAAQEIRRRFQDDLARSRRLDRFDRPGPGAPTDREPAADE